MWDMRLLSVFGSRQQSGGVRRAQIRRRTTQRLLDNDAGRSAVPQHDCPNGR